MVLSNGYHQASYYWSRRWDSNPYLMDFNGMRYWYCPNQCLLISCPLPLPVGLRLDFYKYYNIFYRNCQDFYWLGWLDSNQRNPWFWGMILDYAPIKVLILSFKAMCLTPWLHPILYKYYIIFYNICQDFYWRK